MRSADASRTKSLRLFVAVELPPEVRAWLETTIDELMRGGADRGLRWVRPGGVHITLKFLGTTNQDRLPTITAALREAAHAHAPFLLRPDGLGSFGGRRNLRVLWAGVGGNTAALAALAGGVEAAMAPAGFAPEARPYAAHLTLARVREDAPPAERERLHEIIARLRVEPGPSFEVRHCALMESVIQRGGAVYTALDTFPLEGA